MADRFDIIMNKITDGRRFVIKLPTTNDFIYYFKVVVSLL